MKTKIQKQFSPAAFTLIELLVVISIIAVLSAFIIGGLAAAKKKSNRDAAKAELKIIEAAIESYKSKYNSYPPSNQNPAAANYDPSIFNQLYYELSGVKIVGSDYTTLDGATTIPMADFKTAFGVGGILNVSKGSGDDSISAENFFASGLKANQFDRYVTNNLKQTTVLITSVGGPDASGLPPNFSSNPFHYNSSNPTNNPGAYDLWVDLTISGKLYRIGNWSAK